MQKKRGKLKPKPISRKPAKKAKPKSPKRNDKKDKPAVSRSSKRNYKKAKPKSSGNLGKRAKKAKIAVSKSALDTEKSDHSRPMKDALRELEILAEKKVESGIGEVEKKEDRLERKEIQIMAEEKKIEKETRKLEATENQIKNEVTTRPLSRLTVRDINKGIIGAFIGVVAHFAFIYGRQIAKDLTISRSVILLVFSYVLIVILMYDTGYREVKETKLLGVLPKRATVIYITSMVVIPVIFFLFNQLNLADPTDLFKQISVSAVFASIGAGTADIIGKD